MARNFKVISTSNFGDETFCESQIIGPWLTKDQAERIAGILNEGADEYTRNWFVAAPKDRVLWRGMEELI